MVQKCVHTVAHECQDQSPCSLAPCEIISVKMGYIPHRITRVYLYLMMGGTNEAELLITT